MQAAKQHFKEIQTVTADRAGAPCPILPLQVYLQQVGVCLEPPKALAQLKM